MEKIVYTNKFYECRIDSLVSAQVIVPLVLELIQPRSVVDVGCGTGEFLSIFREQGVHDILGIDGVWINKKNLRIPERLFQVANLEDPLKIQRNFDLAISLEVAEHLAEKSAKFFIENLTSLSSIILFSAAVPLQGGVHHINEQWPEYWVQLFQERGYVPIDIIRRKIWNNDKVSFWYAQNILLFVKKDYLENNDFLKKEFEQTEGSVLSIIHPSLYLLKARRYDATMKIIPYPLKWMIIKLMRVLKFLADQYKGWSL